ncbi:preprotein translocase subunit YajC [Arcicella sp. BE140]|nr:preprotein translocase subunit YajC [Arcicella sp. BE51]MDR6814305.1 preprotein translocase subunit YajC [Arcicella sp. BE140]MDR6825673.1 preprotein translocase subunit YajC [Arcicella sp. BE139]
MAGVKASFSLEYISFGLFFYLPITFVILFFPPYAYLQKQNREKKDMLNTLK